MPMETGMPADRIPGARWRKSSASNPSGCCVELAELAGRRVAVRDSTDASGPALIFTRAEMATFLRGLRDGGASPHQPPGRPASAL